MKQHILPSLALAALLFAGCQSTAPQGPDRFTKADANKDHKLSLDEANTYLVTQIFDSRDADHDGKLTLQEWSVEGAKGNDQLFHDRDANHDGIVTLDEALAYGRKHGMAKKLLQAADTNHDGYLTREEAKAYYAKHGA